ncbi:hypothetical protein [Neorhizobium alkalisoli]|uniref:hypothetical protein n=1 Tax=Neorhizobium alkalisoli TaxID=528178 RepID=UPI000CF98AD2|nr:hypothetical protein [Neorhizobium alkalisoli]
MQTSFLSPRKERILPAWLAAILIGLGGRMRRIGAALSAVETIDEDPTADLSLRQWADLPPHHPGSNDGN